MFISSATSSADLMIASLWDAKECLNPLWTEAMPVSLNALENSISNVESCE